jgi:hypothetical protein
MAAWAAQLDLEEHGPLAECRRRADPVLRERLAAQWRAFAEAQIRDQYPQAPPDIPTHQLPRDSHAPATVPQLADPAFGPLACTCRACTRTLDRTIFRPGEDLGGADGGRRAGVHSELLPPPALGNRRCRHAGPGSLGQRCAARSSGSGPGGPLQAQTGDLQAARGQPPGQRVQGLWTSPAVNSLEQRPRYTFSPPVSPIFRPAIRGATISRSGLRRW